MPVPQLPGGPLPLLLPTARLLLPPLVMRHHMAKGAEQILILIWLSTHMRFARCAFWQGVFFEQ